MLRALFAWLILTAGVTVIFLPNNPADAFRGPRGRQISGGGLGVCEGVQPPPAAAANGLTTLLFCDDFKSTATVCFTAIPGCRWYAGNNGILGWPMLYGGIWESSGNPPYWNSAVSLTQTPNGVQITGLNNGQGNQLWSCTSKAPGAANQFHGIAVPAAPAYFEYNIYAGDSWSGASGTLWNSAIMWPLDVLYAGAGTFTGTFPELDNMDAFPTTFDRRFHDWRLGSTSQIELAGSPIVMDDHNGAGYSSAAGIWGTLILRMADNGGTGIMKGYYNDVADVHAPISWTAYGQLFSDVEAINGMNGVIAHVCMQINVPYQDTMTIRRAAVWGPPGSVPLNGT